MNLPSYNIKKSADVCPGSNPGSNPENNLNGVVLMCFFLPFLLLQNVAVLTYHFRFTYHLQNASIVPERIQNAPERIQNANIVPERIQQLGTRFVSSFRKPKKLLLSFLDRGVGFRDPQQNAPI